MDLGTILTAAIMLSICVLPFILMNRKKQKRIKQLHSNFIKNITEKGLIIGQHEVCGNIVIGFDSTLTQLFFLKQNHKIDRNISIPLNSIIDCKIEKSYEIDNNSMDQSTSLDKIVLTLTTKEAQSKNHRLVLFDCNDRMQLDGELQLGEKWLKIIQEKIA